MIPDTFLGKPVGYWLKLQTVLETYNIKTVEDLDGLDIGSMEYVKMKATLMVAMAKLEKIREVAS